MNLFRAFFVVHKFSENAGFFSKPIDEMLF